jgi:hypothetical protein
MEIIHLIRFNLISACLAALNIQIIANHVILINVFNAIHLSNNYLCSMEHAIIVRIYMMEALLAHHQERLLVKMDIF